MASGKKGNVMCEDVKMHCGNKTMNVGIRECEGRVNESVHKIHIKCQK